MRVPQYTSPTNPSLPAGLAGRLATYWGSRRGLLVLGGIALTLGAALNWSWLAAAGITPILIGLLPCAAMCALGLCMPRLMRPASNAQTAPHDTSSSDATPIATHLQLDEGIGRPGSSPSIAPLSIESLEQSCCHTPTEKENDCVKENS